MQLPSKPVSLITLGTLASLSAYGFVVTRTTQTPAVTKATPPANDQKPNQDDPKIPLGLVQPLAQPETFTPQSLPQPIKSAKAKAAKVEQSTAIAATPPTTNFDSEPTVPPLPPKLKPLRGNIKLENLPVDAYIAESLQPLASPTQPPAAPIAAPEKPAITAITQAAPVQSTPLPPVQATPTPTPLPAQASTEPTIVVLSSPQSSPTSVQNPSAESLSAEPQPAAIATTLAPVNPTNTAAPAAIAIPETLPAKPISSTSEFATPALESDSMQQSYRLKPGDRLQVQVSQEAKANQAYQVMPDGSLELPQIGALTVTGMTLKQVEAIASARYTSLGIASQVNITLVAKTPDATEQPAKILSSALVNLDRLSTR